MIKTEYLNNGARIRHYSDSGKMLKQLETGATYSDAIDVVPCRYTYEEIDISIDEDEDITGDELMAMIEGVL